MAYMGTQRIMDYDPIKKVEFDNEECKERWVRLSQSIDLKPMICSLAPSRDTQVKLKIEKSVREIFSRADLDFKVVFGMPAYKSLVYEFLASFSVPVGDGLLDGFAGWNFRIQNVNFYWPRRLAEIRLGFPMYGVAAAISHEQRLAIWEKLTGLKSYNHASSPASIQLDEWKYIHRLVATGINCQPETMDVVSVDDLNILWAIDQGVPVNWFDIFTERFLKMQAPDSTYSFVGCTSLIALIAKICGFQLYCQHDEFKELDLPRLKMLSIHAQNHDGVAKPREKGGHTSFLNSLDEIWSMDVRDNKRSGLYGEGPSTSRKRKLEPDFEWEGVKRVVVADD